MDTKSGRVPALKQVLIVVPIAVAVLIVALLVGSKDVPQQRPAQEIARQVRILEMAPMDVVPRAIGYGLVSPGRVWQVVPEVSGRLVYVDPDFKKGSLVRQGQVLLRIDTIDFELAERQMAANIAKIEAQLAELERQEMNHRSTLKIQRTLLDLSQKELARNQLARENRSISDSALDQARMNTQSQLNQVQEIENALALIPASRQSLEADLVYNQARLEEARLDLARTEIVAPYNCRITDTEAEIGQYVQQGQTIATADGIDQAEIAAQLPLSAVRRLLAGNAPTALDGDSTRLDRLRMDNLRALFDLSVRVRLVNAGFGAEWEARFARADATIDAQTRTVGIIVVVDRPYDQVIIGQRPPLVRNMYCEVEISGRPIASTMVIPRSALHDDQVYIVDAQDRLARKPVNVDFSQGDLHVLADGLAAGDRLVVSDLVPAIDGMLLEAVEDGPLRRRLAAQAVRPSTGDK
ncbi:MAG: biotin/lipoyl-binding protein [Desulfosarcinaceae bacterium]|nr:biotin/lipoyl-binding protein [Desulfosarcinaceae bacterium]